MVKNIKIFNTLSGKKEKFLPIKNKRVNLFVCGPTVYDYSHLGHARNYVVFDAFAKYLKKTGYNVFYLQNITDIDDKIIVRAKEKDLALAFEKEYVKDMKLLRINSVSKYAPATEHIEEIISQAERLMQKGYAYAIEGDGIYYDISKFKKYGKLSGRTALQAEDAVSRIDYSKDKRNRGDFCLWKLSQDESEPSWPSPFGKGRPGWHIEDTAITEKFFGPQYDIHGAGRDLIFPHHEAEISQMEAVSGKSPMAKYWMHVGFLTINGQKMSKSLGNFIAISDFLQRYSGGQLRFFILKNLWRSPVDYSESIMMEVKSALQKIEEFLRKIKSQSPSRKAGVKSIARAVQKLESDFYKQLDDDFNTPKAFAVLFEFIKKTNHLADKNLIGRKDANNIYNFFAKMNEIFGIIDLKKVNQKIPASIKKLALAREKMRKNGLWQKADEIRQQVEKQGYVIEDTKNGPVVKIRS